MAKYVNVNFLKPDLCDADIEWGTKPVNYSQAAIDDAPAADVAPVVHGSWIPFDDVEDSCTWECSVCHEAYTIMNDYSVQENKYNYCPNCGASMMDAEEGRA